MQARINIITLAVKNLQKALEFYRDGLGLKTRGITEGFSDHVLFELEGGLSLVLFLKTEVAKLDDSNTAESGGCILSHAASSQREVDQIMRRAKEAGGKIVSEAKSEAWGYFGYFKDPDGHLWEILWNPAFSTTP